jgi:hypothetical protein
MRFVSSVHGGELRMILAVAASNARLKGLPALGHSSMHDLVPNVVRMT